MIRVTLTRRDGTPFDFYLGAGCTLQVREASTPEAWHGTRAAVSVNNGPEISVRESREEIAAQVPPT